MERIPRTAADAEQLIALGKLLTSSIQTVTDEWSKEDYPAKMDTAVENAKILPSHRLHQAQRTILAIAGSLTEMVIEPFIRLQEFSSQFWEARALGLAVERRIPDILEAAGDEGLGIEALAEKTKIEEYKLSRVMRCLCSNHVFRQTASGNFANNRITAPLAHNEEFRAYVLAYHMDLYSASERLPQWLLGPQGASYSVSETAFQPALGTAKTRWDWLAERVRPDELVNPGPGYAGVADPDSWGHLKVDEDGLMTRPELDNFGLAMVGSGKASGAALPFDYPWKDLPKGSTVVDVGGGVGGFIFQLLSAHPHLNYVVQDRPEVIDQAKQAFWPEHGPEVVQSGQVTLQPHDFFKANPVQGATVYAIRSVLHDWSDEYCIKILAMLKESMADDSRILICDQIMNTTAGCDEMEGAPWPLPANYGYYTRYQHQRDVGLMAVMNGIERTPQQFKQMIEKAGLRMTGIYEPRSVFGIVEVRK